jgi:hypothetical protein
MIDYTLYTLYTRRYVAGPAVRFWFKLLHSQVAPLLRLSINIYMSIHYTLETESRNGAAHYTLIDTEQDRIIVSTSYKPLVDWVVAQGVRQIVPAEPRHLAAKRTLY